MSGAPEPPPEPDEMDLGKVHGSILREHQEPGEGRVGVPTWFVLTIMALVFWGGFYLATNGGGFRADGFVPAPFTPAAPLDPATLGRRTFVQNCVICHQADGQGVPRQYPPLAGSEWVLGEGGWRSEHLMAVLLGGLEGPAQVRGATFNGAMPSWRFLRDEQIAAVLTYIRGDWGNAAAPVTVEAVRAARGRMSGRGSAWTQEELRAMPADAAPGGAGH